MDFYRTGPESEDETVCSTPRLEHPGQLGDPGANNPWKRGPLTVVGDQHQIVNSSGVTQRQPCEEDLDNSRCASGSSDGEDDLDSDEDPVYEKIASEIDSRSVSSKNGSDKDSSSSDSEDQFKYTHLQYGFLPMHAYKQAGSHGDIQGLCFNGRFNQFLIMDPKGVTAWKFSAYAKKPISRVLDYGSYQYRLYSKIIYTREHNVYFALGRDYSLKILNSDFEETYTVDANLRNVMVILFNPVRDELITGGLGGVKVWAFKQVNEDRGWQAVRAMANYKLVHKYALSDIGGGWVKKVELDNDLQHLYCCSETDLYAYDLSGQLLFSFKGAHDMSITGCVYSRTAQLLVTSSMDCKVKVWNIKGGLLHTFRGHSKPVTQVLIHRDLPSCVLSCSHDSSVKMWSLDTMELMYSITVSIEGIHWMGFTDDWSLYVCTRRQLTVWNINHFCSFWGTVRAPCSNILLGSADNKTTRALVTTDDNCIRLFSVKNKEKMSTICPPPNISPLSSIQCLTYSRRLNLVYCLVNPFLLMIYTMRTDPACLISKWDLGKIQEQLISNSSAPKIDKHKANYNRRKSSVAGGFEPSATTELHPNSTVSKCIAICLVPTHVIALSEEGLCSPLSKEFLLLGLEDGRILFMDPFVKNRLHVDFRANKDKISAIHHDPVHDCLLIRSDRIDLSILQLWSLPDLHLLHEIYLYSNLIDYKRLDSNIFCGYADGSTSFNFLEPVSESQVRHFQIRSENDLKESQLITKRFEHRSPLLSVEVCPTRAVFLSSDTSGVIKIWSESSQAVIVDILLDTTLSFATFMNPRGDLIVSFKNNLFSIFANKVYKLNGRSQTDMVGEEEREEDGATSVAESDIYENPTVIFEGIGSYDEEPVTMKNYLKPFDLDFSKEFMEGTAAVLDNEKRFKIQDDEESVRSAAHTSIYTSGQATPALSMMDLTLNTKVTAGDIEDHINARRELFPFLSQMSEAELQYHKNREERTRRQQQAFDVFDITDATVADHYLPLFGTSPGATPTCSSLSSLDFNSDFSLSVDVSEDDGSAAGDAQSPTRGKAKDPNLKKSKKGDGKGKKGKISSERRGSKRELKIMHDYIPEKKTDDPRTQTPRPTTESLFSNIKIDPSELMPYIPGKTPKKKIGEFSTEDIDNLRYVQSLRQTQPVKRADKRKTATQVRRRVKGGGASTPPPSTTTADKPAEKHGHAKRKSITKRASVDTTSTKKRGSVTKGISDQASTLKVGREGDEDDIDLSPYMAETPVPRALTEIDSLLSEYRSPSGGDSYSHKSYTRGASMHGGAPSSAGISTMRQRTTPGLSDTDMVDELDDLLDGHATPYTVAESIGSGAPPLPHAQLPDGDTSLSEALSRWVTAIGDEPMSEGGTRPETRVSEVSYYPQPPTVSMKSTIKHPNTAVESTSRPKSILKVSSFYQKTQDSSPATPYFASKLRDTRPATVARTMRSKKSAGVKSRLIRPYTAPASATKSMDDMQIMFQEAWTAYQKHSGTNKLYHNSGTEFEVDWETRAIERHKLMLMQNQMRMKSAAHRRQVLQNKSLDKAEILSEWREQDMLAKGFIPSMDEVTLQTKNDKADKELVMELKNKIQRIADSSIPFRGQMNPEIGKAKMEAIELVKREKLKQTLACTTTASRFQNASLHNRPMSSKSIPSRCTKYVLVKQTPGKKEFADPTILERSLLRERFPKDAQKITPLKLPASNQSPLSRVVAPTPVN